MIQRAVDDLGSPAPLSGVVVPLAGLKATLDIDQLPRRQVRASG